MFLQWVAKCELVPLSNDSYVLKKFSEKCQRGMCSMVVGFLSGENVDLADVLPSGHHIRWSMEVIGHSFALTMEDADVIMGAVRIYEKWLGVAEGVTTTSGKIKDFRPACMQKVEQVFIQDILGQMTLLFDDRSDRADASARVSEAHLSKHVSLCIKVLDIFDALAKRRGSQLSPQTWDRMLRLLLGAADAVLHNPRSALGNHLCSQLIRLLFEMYIRSLLYCGPRGEIWALLQKFCRRWIHRILVIEQWNAVELALTKSLIRHIHVPDAGNEIEITWAETRTQSKFELDSSLIAYAWYRLLRVIGHPSGIADPDVYLAAIKGISRLADEFSRVEKLPRVQWRDVLGALNSAPNRDNSIFKGMLNDDHPDLVDHEETTQEDNAGSLTQPRAPPDVNTILRLLGPWLFDACLTRKPRFAAGRSEALRCLGKLLCNSSSGRSKRINWAYGIRSLMALQGALLDEDERISAAAVYNWSKVFGLYGNHTLRGAGVITGSFHKAIERVFRSAERREISVSPKAAGDTKRNGDTFFAQDEHSIGGIPIVLLRRASIEACSSLLTLHAHLPRPMIKEAEKEIVMPSMIGLPGLYSSLPKYTSSNVVTVLMNAMKTETDPTNQQMILWILTVAIQQEATYWVNGLASSRNSQVQVTILLICSMISSKSGRYKPPVLFTAFECLRHLSLVCDELFSHASSSVTHLVNACCDFITNSAPILRSSRAPFYLDGLMATAYYCIIEWIIAAPLLLAKSQVVSKIITTVIDGNERIQSFTSKSTAIAVREAAQKLDNMLMKHHVAKTNNVGSLTSRSSVLSEKTVLAEFCAEEIPDGYNHCRFFALNKTSILTVIEKPPTSSVAGEAILIVRDSTGRYVWRSKPRYCDGPRPKSLVEFEVYMEANRSDSDDVDTEYSDDDVFQEEDDERTSHEDPLLQAIRDTNTKSNLMSWRSRSTGNLGVVDAEADSTKVLSGEGNTGMTSMIERKAQAISREEARNSQDVVFMDLLVLQSNEEKQASTSRDKLDRGIRCKKPLPPEKDKALQSWEVSRRMMSELGFLSVRNWGSVFMMDACSGELLRDLEALDILPDREAYDIAIAYAISSSSRGGYDNIRIVNNSDVRSGNVVLSNDYQLFLASLGERVNAHNHTGYIGGLDATRLNGRLMSYSHYSYESRFYVPTLEGDIPDQDSSTPLMSLLRGANVLIVWNESQQAYQPGSVLWETTFKLPTPTSRLIIIIDPLGNDLFCVHITHDSSPLFNQRDVITNEEDNYMDEEEVFCARVLGPLQDGTVVNGAWLGPLVRQTAINAAVLSRSFHRYQHNIGEIATAPVSPEANRERVISSIIEKHIRPKLPGEFYGGLFDGLTSEGE